MKTLREKHYTGLTLIEVMVAMVVIIVAVMGAMGFRYYSALDARKADVQVTAGRLGLILLEGWKSAGGRKNYDPIAVLSSELVIADGATGPAVPAGFTALPNGSYAVAVNRVNYYATLSYKTKTLLEPRVLNVCVSWLRNYGTGVVSSTNRSVKMTTYVNN